MIAEFIDKEKEAPVFGDASFINIVLYNTQSQLLMFLYSGAV